MTTPVDMIRDHLADEIAEQAQGAFYGHYDGTNDGSSWAAVGEVVADGFALIGWRCGADDENEAPAWMLKPEPCPWSSGCEDRPVWVRV